MPAEASGAQLLTTQAKFRSDRESLPELVLVASVQILEMPERSATRAQATCPGTVQYPACREHIKLLQLLAPFDGRMTASPCSVG